MGLTRAVLGLLTRSGDASVTFTLDTRGTHPCVLGGYAVAKAGLSALAKILADEWEPRYVAHQRSDTRTDSFASTQSDAPGGECGRAAAARRAGAAVSASCPWSTEKRKWCAYRCSSLACGRAGRDLPPAVTKQDPQPAEILGVQHVGDDGIVRDHRAPSGRQTIDVNTGCTMSRIGRVHRSGDRRAGERRSSHRL